METVKKEHAINFPFQWYKRRDSEQTYERKSRSVKGSECANEKEVSKRQSKSKQKLGKKEKENNKKVLVQCRHQQQQNPTNNFDDLTLNQPNSLKMKKKKKKQQTNAFAFTDFFHPSIHPSIHPCNKYSTATAAKELKNQQRENIPFRFSYLYENVLLRV